MAMSNNLRSFSYPPTVFSSPDILNFVKDSCVFIDIASKSGLCLGYEFHKYFATDLVSHCYCMIREDLKTYAEAQTEKFMVSPNLDCTNTLLYQCFDSVMIALFDELGVCCRSRGNCEVIVYLNPFEATLLR
jgi:hypothetical protein